MVEEVITCKDIHSCPHCGHFPLVLHGIENDKYQVLCNNSSDCDFLPETLFYPTLKAALQAWKDNFVFFRE